MKIRSTTILAVRRDGVTAGRLAIGNCRMTIAPNPLASGFATVRYSLPRAGAAQVSVYNIAGQAVLSQALVLGASGSLSLDLRQLAGGVYLVKLQTQDFTVTQKLVVQR